MYTFCNTIKGMRKVFLESDGIKIIKNKNPVLFSSFCGCFAIAQKSGEMTSKSGEFYEGI